MRRTPIAAALWVWLSASTALAAAPDLDKAQTLMREGKAAEAYALLAPQEFDRAGDVNFDYLLGTAALDSGKPDKATLAFERVLAVNPDFLGARLDLGRAYFAMGDYPRATVEFETILARNPPPAAKITGERYLAEIEQRLHPRTSWTGYTELTLGRDTNVNNSTSSSQVYVPLFGATFTLSPTSVKTADNYRTLGVGGELRRPIRSDLTFYAGVDGRKRMNYIQDTFDNGTLDGRVGALIGEGRDTYRVEANSGLYYLDNVLNRHTSGFTGEWRHAYTPKHQISVFGQYSLMRYPDMTLKSSNTNQTIGGLGWLRALAGPTQTLLFASIYTGLEKDTDERVDGGQRLYGLRFGAQKALSGDTDLFGSVSAKVGDYDRINLSFQNFRHDIQYDLTLALAWRPAENWTVRPQLAYSKVKSNFDLYSYERIDSSITVRRDFR